MIDSLDQIYLQVWHLRISQMQVFLLKNIFKSKIGKERGFPTFLLQSYVILQECREVYVFL